MINTEKKEESRLAVHNSALYGALFWCYPSVVYMIMKKKELLSSTKESRFSKLLSERAILALFFLSARDSHNIECEWMCTDMGPEKYM